MNTLSELRKANGLSMKGLAEAASVNIGTVSRLERGLVSPTLIVAKRIASALNVEVTQIDFESAKND